MFDKLLAKPICVPLNSMRIDSNMTHKNTTTTPIRRRDYHTIC